MDDEQARRARLLIVVSVATTVLLSPLVIRRMVTDGQIDGALVVAIGMSGLVLAAVRARRGRLAEVLMFATAVAETASLVLGQGPASARLGIVHGIVLIMAFIGPLWMPIAYA